MTPEEQAQADCAGRIGLPGALLYYPASRPISRELAEHVQRAWAEACRTGNPLILPDDWRVEVLR